MLTSAVGNKYMCRNTTLLYKAFTIDSEITVMPLNTTCISSFEAIKNLP